MKYSKNTKENKKEKFDLQECFTLWLHNSKNGVKYLTGYDFNKNRLVAFFNKKNNEKQPTLRIYDLKEDGSTGEEIITLWESVSKQDRTYLNGLTNEKENVIAFYGDEKDEVKPYIKGYFKKD